MQVLCQAELQPQGEPVLYQNGRTRQSGLVRLCRFGGGFPCDSGGIAPEPFEVVERSGFGLEDVDDHIAVIEEDPFGFGDAFLAGWAALEAFFELFGDLVGEALDLSVGAAGCDDEHSGDLEKVSDVQQREVGCFLVVQRVGGGAGQVDRFGGELGCDRGAFPSVVADDDSEVEDSTRLT